MTKRRVDRTANCPILISNKRSDIGISSLQLPKVECDERDWTLGLHPLCMIRMS